MKIVTSDIEYSINAIADTAWLLKRTKILITGGTGFFGRLLLESFLKMNQKYELDASLYILSRNPEKFLSKFPEFKNESNIIWLTGDIRNFIIFQDNFNYIIHGATEANASLNIENPLLMLDTITEGTRRVLEFARVQKDLRGILVISSGAIYGKQPNKVNKIKETDGFNINLSGLGSAYAEGKRLSELLSFIYSVQYNTPIMIARCFAFIGPYLPLNNHFAIGNFINDGLKGKNITVHGDGKQLRSYMYSADLVIWLWTILLKGKKGEAYNVGSDYPISIKDLAYVIANFFPKVSVNILNQKFITDRNQNYIPDIRKAKKEFKFRNEISLQNAILRTINYHKQND